MNWGEIIGFVLLGAFTTMVGYFTGVRHGYMKAVAETLEFFSKDKQK